MMKKDGMYYMMSSFCTGWAPNQGKYSVSRSIGGTWRMLEPIGDATTYASQPAFILPVQSGAETLYLYAGDRWDGKNYHNSSYIFLPLRLEDDGSLHLDWYEEIDIDTQKGIIADVCT